MAYLELNGVSVAEGYLEVPAEGRWHAEVRMVADPGRGEALLRFEDGTAYRGVIRTVTPDKGLWRVAVVGGRGGLSRSLPPRYYQGIPLATVLRDLLNEAGEQAEVKAPEIMLRWVRPATTAQQALRQALAGFPGLSWWVRPDGVVEVGPVQERNYPEPLIALEALPGQGWRLMATPDLQPRMRMMGIINGILTPMGRSERVAQRVGLRLSTEVWSV